MDAKYCAALTVLFALAQMIALAFMVVGIIPGGASGVKMFGSLVKSSVTTGSSALPV
ncbi:hypothetical protein GQX74_013744 [Glossina fuscipes]|nr:hypothetical protein GQX74_013744 [Glossina fuscipes]